MELAQTDNDYSTIQIEKLKFSLRFAKQTAAATAERHADGRNVDSGHAQNHEGYGFADLRSGASRSNRPPLPDPIAPAVLVYRPRPIGGRAVRSSRRNTGWFELVKHRFGIGAIIA
jgi:hypothetical protein